MREEKLITKAPVGTNHAETSNNALCYIYNQYTISHSNTQTLSYSAYDSARPVCIRCQADEIEGYQAYHVHRKPPQVGLECYVGRFGWNHGEE